MKKKIIFISNAISIETQTFLLYYFQTTSQLPLFMSIVPPPHNSWFNNQFLDLLPSHIQTTWPLHKFANSYQFYSAHLPHTLPQYLNYE